jgi:hypothetical protein
LLDEVLLETLKEVVVLAPLVVSLTSTKILHRGLELLTEKGGLDRKLFTYMVLLVMERWDLLFMHMLLLLDHLVGVVEEIVVGLLRLIHLLLVKVHF